MIQSSKIIAFCDCYVKTEKKIHPDLMQVRNGLVSYLISDRNERLYVVALTILLCLLEID